MNLNYSSARYTPSRHLGERGGTALAWPRYLRGWGASVKPRPCFTFGERNENVHRYRTEHGRKLVFKIGVSKEQEKQMRVQWDLLQDNNRRMINVTVACSLWESWVLELAVEGLTVFACIMKYMGAQGDKQERKRRGRDRWECTETESETREV
jgi:hypothetical protein